MGTTPRVACSAPPTPNGRSATSTYDPLSNALSFVNAAQEPISYTHNTAGQLTSATFPDNSSYTYTYDGEGHLTAATDANGSVVFTYDPATRFLTKVAYPNGLFLTFACDAGGRRISMADQTGFTTNYAYDALGRLYPLKDGSGTTIVTYLYDDAGRLSKKTNGNATYSTYDYDANGHVLHLINYAPGGTINSRFDDTYNALGLKTAESTLDGAWTYTYDANGQLTHAVLASTNAANVPNQDLAYNYDPMGNRTSTVINGLATAYVVNNMNQYVSVGGVAFSYDAKGNISSNGQAAYTFSVSNKLVSVADTTGTSAITYNALGQEIASNTDGQLTQYLIDPARSGTVDSSYPGGGGKTVKQIHGLGLVGETDNNVLDFYDFDSLGNTVGTTGVGADVLARYGYDPFGHTLVKSANVSNPSQFVGEWGADLVGGSSVSMRARVYLPNIGRFSSNDPLGVAGGINFYGYAANNSGELD